MAKAKVGDVNCSFCGRLVRNKKGVVSPYQVRAFGDKDKPVYKSVCSNCDNELGSVYRK